LRFNHIANRKGNKMKPRTRLTFLILTFCVLNPLFGQTINTVSGEAYDAETQKGVDRS